MKRGVPDCLQYFGITCCLLVPVYCGLERTCTPEVKARGPRGACGRALTELLSTACMFYGGYNSLDVFKRNFKNGNYLSNKDETTALQKREDIRGDLKAKLATKREAFSFLVKKSEYDEQGVVCECCYHKCRFRELTDYCANGGGRMTFDFFKKRSHNSDAIDSGNSDDYSGKINQARRNGKTENNIDNERDLDKFTPP